MQTDKGSQKVIHPSKDASPLHTPQPSLDDLCAVRRAQACPNRAETKGPKMVCEREVITRQRILERMRSGELVTSKDVLETPYCLYSHIKRGHIHAGGMEKEYLL